MLGASGMLGSAILRFFIGNPSYEVVGSVRSFAALRLLPSPMHSHVISGVDVENADMLTALFAKVRPAIVINCVGLVKQLAEADDPLSAIPINALLPHRLAKLCALGGSRLIHISTDCVFRGTKGMYREEDVPDSTDLYGRSKHLGEVDYPEAVTLRTSIIGPELNSNHGLVGWFLSRHSGVKGYTRAIFSGLPTVELARVIRDFVMPYPDMRGVYHVSAEPISKYELLRLVAAAYRRRNTIDPDDSVVIDRSLDSARFRDRTGYQPPSWPELIKRMHDFG